MIRVGRGHAHHLDRDLERVGAQLCQHGVRPLADIHRAGAENDGAVFLQPHDGAGAQKAADLPGDRHAQRFSGIPASGVACPFDAVTQPVRPDGRAGEPAFAGPQDVSQPHLCRVEAAEIGQLIDLAFTGESHLNIAKPAIGAKAHAVGVDQPPVAADMRDAVGPRRHQQRVAQHARAVVAICAAFQQHLDLAGDQHAIRRRAGLHPYLERMARADGFKILFSGQDQLYRAAGFQRQRDGDRLNMRLHLIAEPGADGGRHRPDAGLRDA